MSKKKVDKNLFYKAKERIGQPWTYSDKTKALLEEDASKEKNDNRVLPTYEPVQKAVVLPKKDKPLQQMNGRRSQCVGFKDGFKVGSERNLQPIPKDFIKVAQAKRLKIKTVKFRKSPK